MPNKIEVSKICALANRVRRHSLNYSDLWVETVPTR